MFIYHYSNKNFKGAIKPSFFGLNYYSKQSSRESSIDRSFFYIGKGKESFFDGVKYKYTATIEAHKIYNLEKDIKNLKEKLSFNDILKHVKKLGYIGLSGNNGYNVVCLFYPVKYINKEVLLWKSC